MAYTPIQYKLTAVYDGGDYNPPGIIWRKKGKEKWKKFTRVASSLEGAEIVAQLNSREEIQDRLYQAKEFLKKKGVDIRFKPLVSRTA